MAIYNTLDGNVIAKRIGQVKINFKSDIEAVVPYTGKGTSYVRLKNGGKYFIEGEFDINGKKLN